MSKSLTVVESIKNTINSKPFAVELRRALPDHVSVQKFQRVSYSAVLANPKLAACDRASLFQACLTCASDGLLPDGQEAAIVPFKGKARYMPMVKGLLKKARNSGELVSIYADTVYTKDGWEFYSDETGVHLRHEPADDDDDRGEFRLVYCVAKTIKDGVYIQRMTKKQVDKVRRMSKQQDGPWKEWYDEMAIKSVIRRISKVLPMSTDLDDVVKRDDDLYDLNKDIGGDPVAEDADDFSPAPPRSKKPNRAADIAKSRRAKDKVEPDAAPEPPEEEPPAEEDPLKDAPL